MSIPLHKFDSTKKRSIDVVKRHVSANYVTLP